MNHAERNPARLNDVFTRPGGTTCRPHVMCPVPERDRRDIATDTLHRHPAVPLECRRLRQYTHEAADGKSHDRFRQGTRAKTARMTGSGLRYGRDNPVPVSIPVKTAFRRSYRPVPVYPDSGRFPFFLHITHRFRRQGPFLLRCTATVSPITGANPRNPLAPCPAVWPGLRKRSSPRKTASGTRHAVVTLAA